MTTESTIMGHPRGLVILFLTEMWERFSYYGMRGLLVIYLTQHFLFSDEKSTVLYGAYTSLVYVMTIVGGALADRYLGARKAVTFGAGKFVAIDNQPHSWSRIAPSKPIQYKVLGYHRFLAILPFQA